MLKLNVVVVSTRPERVGLAVGQWFHRRAVAHGRFEAVFVDLQEFALPLLDEPEHPKLRTSSPCLLFSNQGYRGSGATNVGG